MLITRNMIRCKLCGDIIESKTEHDFKWCSCHCVSVDGGKTHLSRSFKGSRDDFEELSICIEE